MTFGVSHDEARDGTTVNTSVDLLMDDARPFARCPWRVTVRVSGERTRKRYYRTRNGADATAHALHSTSLAEHGGKGTS